MAQNTSDNFQLNAGKDLDNRRGVLQSGVWRAYNDLAEYNSVRPLPSRYATETFWILNPNDSNKADLYVLRKDKTPYRLLEDVDFSNYYTIQQINNLLSPLQDGLSESGVGVYKLTTVITDTGSFLIPDLIGLDVFDIKVYGGTSYNITTDPEQTLSPEDVYFNIDSGAIQFESRFAPGTKVGFLYNKNTQMVQKVERTVTSYAAMIELVGFERQDVFYQYNVSSDEENGGDNPSQYLRFNGAFIRNVPQEATI